MKQSYLHNIGTGEELDAILQQSKRHSMQRNKWTRFVWSFISKSLAKLDNKVNFVI